MSEWLRTPRTFAQGTKMTFAGLSDPQDRADVMLYLNQHGGRCTVPPPPAAARRPKATPARTAAMPPRRPGQWRARGDQRRRAPQANRATRRTH